MIQRVLVLCGLVMGGAMMLGGISPATAQSPDPVILPFNNGQTTHIRLATDSFGVQHAAYANQDTGVVYYAQCVANCNDISGWLAVEAVPAPTDYDSLEFGTYPLIEVTADGRPRIGVMHHYLTENPLYSYAECNANCTQISGWQSVNLLRTPYGAFTDPELSAWFNITSNGEPRMVLTFEQSTDDIIRDLKQVVYVYCNASDCANSTDNWFYNVVDEFVVISSVDTPRYELQLTRDDRPMILVRADDLNPDENPDKALTANRYLTLYECLRDCEDEVPTYRSGVIFDATPWGLTDFTFVLDNFDRPRVAGFGIWPALGGDTAEATIGHCDAADCTQVANWSWNRIDPSDRNGYGYGIGMTFDDQNRPHLAFFADEAEQDLWQGYELVQHAFCVANCDDLDAIEWGRTTLYNYQLLGTPPPPYESICTSMGWDTYSHADISFGGGSLQVAVGTTHSYACGGVIGSEYNPDTGEYEADYSGDIFTVYGGFTHAIE